MKIWSLLTKMDIKKDNNQGKWASYNCDLSSKSILIGNL